MWHAIDNALLGLWTMLQSLQSCTNRNRLAEDYQRVLPWLLDFSSSSMIVTLQQQD